MHLIFLCVGTFTAYGWPLPPASLHSIPLIGSVPTPLPLSSSPSAPVTTTPSTSVVGMVSSGLPTFSFPSLLTLMYTPLPASLDPNAAAKTYSSLIISPVLPPIPSKVVERARSGAFVDFKEFLFDNTLLVQKLQELGQAGAIPVAAQPLISNSRMREVSDPLTWASFFLAYLATKTGHDETRKLAAYGMILLQLACKNSGSGWLLYDQQFSQQQAASASLSWVEINPSLMAATVLGQPAEVIPSLSSLPSSRPLTGRVCLGLARATQANSSLSSLHMPGFLITQRPSSCSIEIQRLLLLLQQ